jgi:hypothetical protein
MSVNTRTSCAPRARSERGTVSVEFTEALVTVGLAGHLDTALS